MARYYAVLTGDLVGSTALTKSAMDRARKTLHAAVDDLVGADWIRGRRKLVRGKAEFFRGDAWQCLLTEPAWALRAAVFIRASLRARADVDTRVSIGVGPVESVSTSRVSLSRGAAFTLSGQGLDDRMGTRFRLAIVTPKDWDAPASGWLESVARLCDSVIVQWQGRQIELARLLCLHPGISQEAVGALLKPAVSQQAVGKAMRSAGWYGVEDALERFEGGSWIQP